MDPDPLRRPDVNTLLASYRIQQILAQRRIFKPFGTFVSSFHLDNRPHNSHSLDNNFSSTEKNSTKPPEFLVQPSGNLLQHFQRNFFGIEIKMCKKWTNQCRNVNTASRPLSARARQFVVLAGRLEH